MITADRLQTGERDGSRPGRSPERQALWLLVAGVAVVVAVGGLLRLRTDLHLGVIPFHGGPGFGVGWGTPVALAVAAVLVAVLPAIGARVPFGLLPVTATVATIVWAVAVAAQRSLDALSYPLSTRWDYWQAVPAVRALGPRRFLATYVDRLGSYPVHVQGHPPGMLLFLWGLGAAGLHGRGWAAAAIIVVGATTPAAVLLTLRWRGADAAARAAFPFLVLAPAVLFVATVGDGVFAAVTAWAAALLAGAARRRCASAWISAGASGALMAVALHLTYGVLPLLVALTVTIVGGRRYWSLLIPVVCGLLGATAPFFAAGFRWWDGLAATRHWYAVGAASERPYAYFLVANLIAFALMLGPAVVAALSRRPPPDVVALVLAAIVAVVVADVSGLSKGEVERIWLPMMPWVSLAVVGLVRRSSPADVRRWLAAGAGLTLTLQIFVAWPW
jgi:hypothetical protein